MVHCGVIVVSGEATRRRDALIASRARENPTRERVAVTSRMCTRNSGDSRMSELDVDHRVNGTRQPSDTLSFLTLPVVWYSITRGYDIRTRNG